MNKFINKILKESEDSSDDFFQSKHINKRREEFENEKLNTLKELNVGLDKIKEACVNKRWKSKESKLFLKIFSKLHVILVNYDNYYRYDFLNTNNEKVCSYVYDELWLDVNLVWNKFEYKFGMSSNDIHLFFYNKFSHYFKVYLSEIT